MDTPVAVEGSGCAHSFHLASALATSRQCPEGLGAIDALEYVAKHDECLMAIVGLDGTGEGESHVACSCTAPLPNSIPVLRGSVALFVSNHEEVISSHTLESNR